MIPTMGERGSGMRDEGEPTGVHVRPVRYADALWLTSAGLDPEKIGRQYHWTETPLQLYIAPARAVLGPRRSAAAVIEVDGRRAGYIGCNPLSGNLEYFLQPWARGRGVGSIAIAAFLAEVRIDDKARRFMIKHGNDRSAHALQRALDEIGWTEGDDYWMEDGRFELSVWVRSTSTR
jgi:hypothetical protein